MNHLRHHYHYLRFNYLHKQYIHARAFQFPINSKETYVIPDWLQAKIDGAVETTRQFLWIRQINRTRTIPFESVPREPVSPVYPIDSVHVFCYSKQLSPALIKYIKVHKWSDGTWQTYLSWKGFKLHVDTDTFERLRRYVGER